MASSNSVKKTPLMRQYDEIKAKYPDELLLFRMGDFYELFGEDAKTASEVLNITLTQRNKKSGDETLMCGFPHHSMEAPVNKLLQAGFSVAVCNQLEDPSQAKGIVKRGVTLELSPGAVFNINQLDQNEACYIFTFDQEKSYWLDSSTGKAFYKKTELEEVPYLINKIKPKEVLIKEERLQDALGAYTGKVQRLFQKERSRFLLSEPLEKVIPLYLQAMQGEEALFNLSPWVEVKAAENLKTGTQFFKHLEIFESNEGDKSKSLFWSIKKTKSPGGTRLLRQILENPLKDLIAIQERQKNILKWSQDFAQLKKVRELFAQLGDLERRIARAGHPLGGPQDLLRLKRSLQVYLEIFGQEAMFLEELQSCVLELEASIEEEGPGAWQSKGGFIKKGFSPELDQLIDLSMGAQSEIQALEEGEKEKTGISSLKVRFNNVFGYYIEVTKTHKDKVPSHYNRKQTLTNSERYITEELAEIEERVLSAKTKKLTLEKDIFKNLKEGIREKALKLKAAAELCSSEDLYSSMAFLMIEKNYSLPKFNDQMEFHVKDSFHPVVFEDLIKRSKINFVTNSYSITSANQVSIISGPNMAGKSTLMRQLALVSYLAQCGLPVPATQADLPLYEALYTRIGASDLLSEGLSTFMVEMKESAQILNEANERSLLVLDEIGRGTSSQDGLALAKSILDYILTELKSQTLFATHYHELTDEYEGMESVANIHMSYVEKEEQLHFTYKVKEGASEKSYGVEVAKLAGLPHKVISKARSLSAAAEKEALRTGLTASTKAKSFPQLDEQYSLLEYQASPLDEELKKMKPLEMTPMEALNKLIEWQENYL